MARNGSGNYSPPTNSWSPAVNSVAATAVDWNSILNDLSAALTQSVSRDGQAAMTGNLPMGGNKLTGLAAGTGTGDSLRFEQLFDQGIEQDVASAATTDIGVINSNFIRITGTTTITSFGTSYKGPRFVRFADALILTHNASTLVIPGGANITTVAGDRAIIAPIGNPASGWQIVAYQKANGSTINGSTDTTRVDVASAATVDLTASAPNTRNINITGTTTITAFTVAAGQTYFVRFDGVLTLTNNASIVTNSGASITTAAGDTCIIRATAANTVEVLSFVGRATSAQAKAGVDVSRLLTPFTLKEAQIQLGTAVTLTTQTAVDFTGIPSWANRITVLLGATSTSGTSQVAIRLGTSVGFATSGYNGHACNIEAGTAGSFFSPDLLPLEASGAAAYARYGRCDIRRVNGNEWVMSSHIGVSGAAAARNSFGGGGISLGGTLDRVRLTTVNGTDTFDGGSVNISWE